MVKKNDEEWRMKNGMKNGEKKRPRSVGDATCKKRSRDPWTMEDEEREVTVKSLPLGGSYLWKEPFMSAYGGVMTNRVFLLFLACPPLAKTRS